MVHDRVTLEFGIAVVEEFGIAAECGTFFGRPREGAGVSEGSLNTCRARFG